MMTEPKELPEDELGITVAVEKRVCTNCSIDKDCLYLALVDSQNKETHKEWICEMCVTRNYLKGKRFRPVDITEYYEDQGVDEFVPDPGEEMS